jgi:Ca2+-binding EF-hand superfamily protein
MISGISGVDSSYYLRQLQQSQTSGLSTAQVFGAIDTNRDGSISKDELTTYQSNMATQFKSSVMGSQADSTSALLALLQSAGLATAGSSASTAATSNSTTSLNSNTTAAQLFSKIDTNGDGSISKVEFAKAGAAIHRHHHHGAQKTDSQNGQASPMNQLFSKIDTNGDGSVNNDELTTFLTNLGTMTNPATTTGKKLTATA